MSMGGFTNNRGLAIERYDLRDRRGLRGFLERAWQVDQPEEQADMSPETLVGLLAQMRGRTAASVGVVAVKRTAESRIVAGYATVAEVQSYVGGLSHAVFGDVYVAPDLRGGRVGAALIETMVNDFDPGCPVIDKRDVMGRLAEDVNGELQGFPPRARHEPLHVAHVRDAIRRACPPLQSTALIYDVWIPSA